MKRWTAGAVAALAITAGLIIHAGNPDSGSARPAAVVADANGNNFESAWQDVSAHPEVLTGGPTYAVD